MTGNGVIVFRLNNGQSFHEHSGIALAKQEAHRLAASIGGRFVIYAPVAIIERTPITQETPVTVPDDDLPF